jgi:hypothetical protein
VAIERVPPRREAGAGLALPVFNKECASTFNLFPSEARRFFPLVPMLAGLCWLTICGAIFGASLSGLRASVILRASRLSGNYATLLGFVFFCFLVGLFSFFIFHLLHYSCVKVVCFF